MVLDQADLADAGLQLGRARLVVDGGELAQQVGDLDPPVAGEVAAHPGPEVLGLADVQDPPGRVAEQVHAGAARQPVGQVDLLEAGPGLGRWELDQVLEGQDPVGAGPLQQAVEHVDGRLGVGQRPVAGGHRRPEVAGQGGQADVGHLVAGSSLRASRACRRPGWRCAGSRAAPGWPGRSAGRRRRCGRPARPRRGTRAGRGARPRSARPRPPSRR